MEIIIRMEEKENPTVGAALREMTGNHWVQAILPKCIELAKLGYTYYAITCSDITVPCATRTLIKGIFENLGINFRADYQGKDNYKLTFSWN